VMLVDMHVGSVKRNCECPSFEMYDTCKHLAAMMLQISDKSSIPEVKIADFMEGIIDSAPLSLNVMSDRVPMKVEYYLTFERSNKVWLELKTGVDHCYVVRNIRELLEHVLQEERHYFTNKFSYEPEEHYFLTQDLEILEMLQAFISTGDIFTDRSYYSDNAYDKITLLIPPLSFLILFVTLVYI